MIKVILEIIEYGKIGPFKETLENVLFSGASLIKDYVKIISISEHLTNKELIESLTPGTKISLNINGAIYTVVGAASSVGYIKALMSQDFRVVPINEVVCPENDILNKLNGIKVI